MENKKKSIKSIFIYLLIIIILAFPSAYIFVNFYLKKEEKINTEKYLYKMPALIVTLSGSNAKRYLKLEVIVEGIASSKKEIEDKFEEKKPILFDTLIMLLADKTVQTVEGYSNKKILKEEIRQKFEKILFDDIKGSTKEIYFQTFLIQ